MHCKVSVWPKEMIMSSLMNWQRCFFLLIFCTLTFVCNYGEERAVTQLAFKSGSDANLTCSHKTWEETLYVVWKLNLTNKYCKIAISNDGHYQNYCDDGKSLRKISSVQSFLHISNFSFNDVGTYDCDLAYKGGNERYKFNISITVPPSISSWIEQRDNKLVAVCKAERGKPAANITWSHMLNPTPVELMSDSSGLFTVESRLELPEGVDLEKLSCAIHHPYWPEEKKLFPKRKGQVPWLRITFSLVFFVLMTGLILFSQKKIKISQCQQSSN
ncbi:cell surface glycoprotein CD200 receptor 1-B-like [Antennarius striatus]|uniref:cell surface glycoprotein CD200 receptor 1-B-like n=1 Tax=Antennarius striatus TaxID=241820 RepID=UPI0035AE6D26